MSLLYQESHTSCFSVLEHDSELRLNSYLVKFGTKNKFYPHRSMELYFRYPCQGEYIYFLGIQYKERGKKSCFQHFSDDQIDFKEAYLAEDSVIPLKHS